MDLFSEPLWTFTVMVGLNLALSLSGLFQHFTVFTNQISSFSQAFELITDTLLTINQCKVWRIYTIEISLILTLQTASRLGCTGTYCAPPRSQVKRRAIVLVLRDNAVKHEKTSVSPLVVVIHRCTCTVAE